MSDRIAVMNRGKILQIGSPNDIYDRPAERFVADFIGDTNFLTAEVMESANGQSVLKLPSGKTVESGQSQVDINGQVNIAIRPEHATLIEDTDGADLQGIVSNIMYSGTDSQFHIKLASEREFVAKVQNSGNARRDWKIGQAVGIMIEPGSVQILRD